LFIFRTQVGLVREVLTQFVRKADEDPKFSAVVNIKIEEYRLLGYDAM
jgi:hypothetical protein